MTYSRQSPSPRYVELLELYKQMHVRGDELNNIPAEETFSGVSLTPHVGSIGSMIARFGAKTLLDYGSGKAEGYEKIRYTLPDGKEATGLKSLWNLDQITHFDPGYEPFSTLPSGTFDAVISTDVLEHCPEEDIDWILEEILSLAGKFAFLTVAVYPAAKNLPTGENAHITVKSAGWWLDRLQEAAQKYPDVRYFLVVIAAQQRMTFIEG